MSHRSNLLGLHFPKWAVAILIGFLLGRTFFNGPLLSSSGPKILVRWAGHIIPDGPPIWFLIGPDISYWAISCPLYPFGWAFIFLNGPSVYIVGPYFSKWAILLGRTDFVVRPIISCLRDEVFLLGQNMTFRSIIFGPIFFLVGRLNGLIIYCAVTFDIWPIFFFMSPI